MNWMNSLEEMIRRYSGHAGGAAAAPADPHADFEKVAQNAPKEVVAGGIAQAFRSDQTPPFPQMLANFFSHSDPNQRAGLLNRLTQVLGAGTLAGLPGEVSSLLGGGNLTPDQADKVSPDQVQQIAEHAQRQDPSVVDEASRFFAEHPRIVKAAAGGMALAVALRHMLARR